MGLHPCVDQRPPDAVDQSLKAPDGWRRAALVLTTLGLVALGGAWRLNGNSERNGPRGPMPLDSGPEFPKPSEEEIAAAWKALGQFEWTQSLAAAPGTTVVARPLTSRGVPMGITLQVVTAGVTELPGPWVLDLCPGQEPITWRSEGLSTVGFSAYVDAYGGRIQRLVPLRLDGGLPNRADLREFGGVVELSEGSSPLPDFLDRTCEER